MDYELAFEEYNIRTLIHEKRYEDVVLSIMKTYTLASRSKTVDTSVYIPSDELFRVFNTFVLQEEGREWQEEQFVAILKEISKKKGIEILDLR